MEIKEVYNAELNKDNFYEKIQKQFAVILGILIVVALVVNLALLTYLGPKGEELSSIRNQQEDQKLKNDLLRAELEDYKVSTLIGEKAEEDLAMQRKDVKIIDSDSADITASSYE